MEKLETAAAIVTGASSGIGYAVSAKLSALGYEVFGLGRNFGETDSAKTDSAEAALQRTGFAEAEPEEAGPAEAGPEEAGPAEAGSVHRIVCDVLDTDRLCALAGQIAAKYPVRVLVNNAGVGYYGLHEELSPRKIKELVRTNLEAPMILTQQLLRHLKKNKGYVINIASVTARESNPHGCAYGATKAGLAGFSGSLFEETRKYGVKVVTILPDMTKTNLYRNADFREGDEAEAYLLPEEVAEAVEFVLSRREGTVVSEISLRPQIRRIKRK